MADRLIDLQFLEDYTNRGNNIFKEITRSSAVWRTGGFGTGSVELRLQELAKKSAHKFCVLSLCEATQHQIHRAKSPFHWNLRRPHYRRKFGIQSMFD
jgi:hypothetical protein